MDLDVADDAAIFASEINVWGESVDINRFPYLGCDIRSSVVVLLMRLTNICAGLMDIIMEWWIHSTKEIKGDPLVLFG